MKKLLGIFGCSKGRTRITTSTKPPEKEDESKPDESKKEEEETSIHLTVAKIKGEGWKLVTDNALSELM